MKFRTLLLSTLILLTSIIYSGNCFSNTLPYYQTQNKQNSNLSYSDAETLYKRVNIDGVWWIEIIEDGVKVGQYMDPDQT